MYVIPAEGLKVRDPFRNDHLPPEGREVDSNDLYWERARIAGDVTVGQSPEVAAEPSPRSRRGKEAASSSDQS